MDTLDSKHESKDRIVPSTSPIQVSDKTGENAGSPFLYSLEGFLFYFVSFCFSLFVCLFLQLNRHESPRAKKENET